MNILVTGGAGYIGSVCVEDLLTQGHLVVVIDNLQEGHRNAVMEDAFFYRGDFGNKALLRKLFSKFNIEAVMHFAAETTIKFSMTDPRLYFHNNMVNGFTLLDVMQEFGCKKFIFSSTAAVFGEPEYNPVDEEHPQSPINAYGESKLMFEKVLEWYHKAYGIKFNILRYFNAAGASEKFGEDHRHETHLIPVIIQSILGQRKKVQIFGNDYATRDGSCIRDYIHVLDLASAHIKALDNLEKHPNGKYNLGNGKGFSNLDVIKSIEIVTNRKVPFEFAPRRPGDPAILIASSKLAQNELDWFPRYQDLESIVHSAWKWHKANPHGYGDHTDP
jgi:UDP-glucose 4-epimerase